MKPSASPIRAMPVTYTVVPTITSKVPGSVSGIVGRSPA
jgi:hypothetical protein